MHPAQLQGFPVAMPAGLGSLLVPLASVGRQGPQQTQDQAWIQNGTNVRIVD